MKHFISLLITSIIIIGMFSAIPASATLPPRTKKPKIHKSGDFRYIVLKNGTAKLTYYKGKDKKLVLPEYLDNHKLTQIDYYVLSNYRVKTVVISKTVKKIYGSSFYGNVRRFKVDKASKYFYADKNGVLYNKKKTVLVRYPEGKNKKTFSVPKTVKKLGGSSFMYAEVRKVVLPEGLSEIGDNAFCESELKKINFPKGLRRIGKNAFEYCVIKSAKFPGTLRVIEKEAFSCAHLRKVKLNKGLTGIAKKAFTETKLKTVTIPSTVKKLAYDAFYYSKVSSISVSSENRFYSSDKDGVLYNKSKTELIIFPPNKKDKEYSIADGVKIIGKKAFDNSVLKFIKFPESLTEIKDRAFCYSDKLEYVEFPSGLKKLGEGAFEDCDALRKLRLNSSLGKIGSWCFYGCGNLVSVTFPESMKVIGKGAFCYCESLSNISLNEGLERIEVSAFSDANISSVKLPSTLKYLSGFDETPLKKIDVPASVRTIGKECFEDCYHLKKVTLRNGLRRIEKSAFYDSSLKKIKLPDTLEYLGENAFEDSSLKTIRLPARLKTLSDNVFPYCLEKITVAKTNRYFSSINGILYNKKKTVLLYYPGCRSLKVFKLPKSVKSIDGWALSEASIKKMIVGGKMKKVGKKAFSYADIKTVVFKKGLKVIGKSAFENASVNEVVLPDTVKRIEDKAFSLCPLKKINIPTSVNSIGKRAFFATKLRQITVPPTVKKIGSRAIGYTYGYWMNSKPKLDKKVSIKCRYNSEAYKYARNNSVKYTLY